MHGLESIDIAAFRFINQALSNRVLDRVMPWFSGNALFVPLLIITAIVLLWKGGMRGRLCVAMLVVILPLGDSWICNTLKRTIGRPRPFNAITDARVLGGRGGSGSMPSSHAANWFAATAIVCVYYRRSRLFMLPLAALVGFSRVYNGMHYPSDVLAGSALGFGYGSGAVWFLSAMWQRAGPRWFPLWWAALPSLRQPGASTSTPAGQAVDPAVVDRHWLRLGYVIVGLMLLTQLAYLASGKIELSEDEAYQWLWSKHLALSYYSKPPLIAYAQFLGTRLWGDTEFGVRFSSPVIGAILSWLWLRFLAREVNARAGFWMVLITLATPLLVVGATLMTIDSLSVLFWSAALLAGWRAVQTDDTRHWLWTGLWMALGFLSKYTELFQLLCWVLFFALWKPARRHLHRPGPYLALLINLLGAVPVLLWNARNGWITLAHLANRGGLDRPWEFSLRYFRDFLGAEFFVLNPVFFVAVIWAAVAVARSLRTQPLPLYLWSMSVPLFLFYTLYTFRALVQPNWIAPSVLPLLCLAVVYWESPPRIPARAIKRWLTAGLTFGMLAAVLLHDTDLLGKIAGRQLPPKKDPLARVRAWRETARAVAEARQKLLDEGKPVFIIGDHYGTTAILSFYLPDAKAGVPRQPLAYYQSSGQPDNQFYFWPGYRDRHGQNAIYVQQVHQPQPPPDALRNEFVSVTDLGMRDIVYRGRVYRNLQLFACRDLR